MAENFEYLSRVLTEYCGEENQITSVCSEFVNKLTDAQINQLGAAYNQIAQREDSARITLRIEGADMRGDPFSRQLFILLLIFENLANRGVNPFVNRQVRLLEFSVKYDWNKLPPDISFLIPFIKRYGRIYSDETRDSIAASIAGDEVIELETVFTRASIYMDLIMDWLNRYELTKHPEAAALHFTLLFLAKFER